jgi:hypothetical protein
VTRHHKNPPSPIRGEERRGEREESVTLSLPLPSDWQPTAEHASLALSLGLDLEHELAAFRAHNRSTGQRFVDWNARFEKWLRGSRDKGKGKPKPGSTTTAKRRNRQQIEGVWFVENDAGELEPELAPVRTRESHTTGGDQGRSASGKPRSHA